MKQYPERPIPKLRGISRETAPKLKPPFSIYNSPNGVKGCQTFKDPERSIKAEKRRFGSVNPRVRANNLIDSKGV